MIVVATADFEVYHEVVAELRSRGTAFTTVEGGSPVPADASAVIVGPGEDREAAVPVIEARPDHPRAAVDEAMAALREGDGRTVVGIDPGTRPGVAVLVDDLIVAAFQVPLEDVADVVRREIEGDDGALVRIGDGSRLQGARLVEDLADATVELVDETGTTPHLGTGTRGMGDVLAAANIARRSGETVEGRQVEPTAGEIEVIKRRSRERSAKNRAITGDLARRVASGELTLAEALEEHAAAIEGSGTDSDNG